MPVTFFAHQAPVLPLVRRDPGRWDGVALVAGSMAPDLAAVTSGWLYGPWGIPLWFDGHRIGNLLPVTIGSVLLAVVVRRIVLPVVPLALPDGGPLHLRDYRRIAQGRPAWWMTVLSALVGVLTHLALDAFTHSDGAVVEGVSALQTSLFTIGGHQVAVYSVLQYGGSIVLAVVAVRSLIKLGRARQFADPSDLGRPPPALTTSQARVFWSIVAAGCVGGVAYAVSRAGRHRVGPSEFVGTKSTVIMAWCWVAFIGLVLACVVLRRAAMRIGARPRVAP